MSSKPKVNDGELLAGVATDLLQFNDPERLLGSLFERISSHTSVDLCFSYLVNGKGLEAVFLGGLPNELHSGIKTLSFGEGVCGLAAQQRCCIKHEAISQSNDPYTAFLREAGIDAFCCYPLQTGGKLLGTLSFGTRRKPAFDSEEVEIQQAIADQAAVAFDRIFLLRELARNNQKLLEANAELKRAHAELEQIAFSASHDLREPVRHLSIYTELLQQQIGSRLEESSARYLSFVLSSAKRVELLLSDLLQYTGVSREEPLARQLDTRAVAEKVCQKLQPLIEETGTVVRVQELPPLQMAEDDLAAVLENLIENAIVYHRSGIAPEILVFTCQTQNGPAICVRDNGVGIDPKHQDTIFGLFRRLTPGHDDTATGIGLTLCRKIVERYKGEIWVESEPGRGALFCFSVATQPQSRAFAAHSGLSK